MKVISREDLNMVKRRILSLALSSMMALSLVACGGVSKSTTDTSAAADGEKSGDIGGDRYERKINIK